MGQNTTTNNTFSNCTCFWSVCFLFWTHWTNLIIVYHTHVNWLAFDILFTGHQKLFQRPMSLCSGKTHATCGCLVEKIMLLICWMFPFRFMLTTEVFPCQLLLTSLAPLILSLGKRQLMIMPSLFPVFAGEVGQIWWSLQTRVEALNCCKWFEVGSKFW